MIRTKTPGLLAAASKIYRKVLMCPPTYFDVVDKLNPHMSLKVPVNKAKARTQWEALRSTLHKHGVPVEVIPPKPGAVDMVFAANAGVVLNNKALITKFAVEPRRVEAPCYAEWFRNNGFEVQELEKIGKPYMFCEGNAEFSPNHDLSHYFYGWGQRSSESALEPIMDFFELQKSDVTKVRMVDERFYHLDTCMVPLSLGHVMLYPKAFDTPSLNKITDALGDEKKLIHVTEEEAMRFCCNSVSFVSGDAEPIVLSPYFSPRLKHLLSDLGYNCVPVDYDQFLLSGGSVRCTVLDINQSR